MIRLRVALHAFLSSAALCVVASGQDAVTRRGEASASFSPFERGSHEVQIGGGFFVSENYFDVYRPQMNDVDATARFGWMLTDPKGPSILRGNFEALVELFGGGFVRGPADMLAGASVLLRYNYVQPNARFVPYVQVGLGGAYSDASKEYPQRELGAPVSFNLQAGFGARYLCTDKVSIFLEVDYRHLSNASLADRNVGLNSGGFWSGLGFMF